MPASVPPRVNILEIFWKVVVAFVVVIFVGAKVPAVRMFVTFKLVAVALLAIKVTPVMVELAELDRIPPERLEIPVM